MKKLSFTMENYLEAVFELSGCGTRGARVSDIAERLGVTKASTNSAMASLSQKGLINNEKYKEIFLTPEGLAFARNTSQKHKTLKEFFEAVLGVPASVAEQDACAIEHVISGDSINAIRGLIKYKNKDGD